MLECSGNGSHKQNVIQPERGRTRTWQNVSRDRTLKENAMFAGEVTLRNPGSVRILQVAIRNQNRNVKPDPNASGVQLAFRPKSGNRMLAAFGGVF